MGSGGGHNPKNCAGVAKEIIQAAEFACYGSLQHCHSECHKLHKPMVVDIIQINYYIDIIAENSNCTAELRKFDKNMKPTYRLCKSMADRLRDVIDFVENLQIRRRCRNYRYRPPTYCSFSSAFN